MKRVIGIGGVFFQAKDPEALREWYRRHLGIDIQPWGGTVFPWNTPDARPGGGMTVWSIDKINLEAFAPSTAPFAINYIVADVDALVAALREEGCDVPKDVEDSEYGKFGWVMDPEGNRVELWQPPTATGLISSTSP